MAPRPPPAAGRLQVIPLSPSHLRIQRGAIPIANLYGDLRPDAHLWMIQHIALSHDQNPWTQLLPHALRALQHAGLAQGLGIHLQPQNLPPLLRRLPVALAGQDPDISPQTAQTLLSIAQSPDPPVDAQHLRLNIACIATHRLVRVQNGRLEGWEPVGLCLLQSGFHIHAAHQDDQGTIRLELRLVQPAPESPSPPIGSSNDNGWHVLPAGPGGAAGHAEAPPAALPASAPPAEEHRTRTGSTRRVRDDAP